MTSPTPEAMASLVSSAQNASRQHHDQEGVERFWSYVDTGGDEACWPWRKARTRLGYGRWRSFGGWMAHRFAWAASNGHRPDPGMFVCHRCDNPPCCNPAHLFLGTPADNTADCMNKGRHSPPPRSIRRGSASHWAKLTEADIPEIRRRRAAGESVRALAVAYGVDKMSISLIGRRKSWSHVP